MIDPGLAPWALQEYRPLGAHCPTATIKFPQYDKQYNQTKTQPNATIHLHPKHIQRTQYHDTTPQTPNPTMSPVRATLLQSPGWNEGKARYGTLGTHRQKQIELRRSGTYSASKCSNGYVKPRTATTQTKCALLVPPLKGLNKCVSIPNPGLAPWAMQEYRPVGALQ